MAWNEPSNKNDDKDNSKDPWTGRDKPKGPPEIDELLRKLTDKFSTLFGKQQQQPPKDPRPNRSFSFKSPTNLPALAGVVLLLAVTVWFLSGFYVVGPAERGVLLLFGKSYTTVEPGLHWAPRFIESKKIINVQNVYSFTYPEDGDADLLTKDENIVSAAVTVRYRINNPEAFLFNAVEPLQGLHQALASTMQQTIGSNDLNAVLNNGREQIRAQMQDQLVKILSRYQSGIEVVDLTIKSLKAPEQVKQAFDDAAKAQADMYRYKNQAQVYALQVQPVAQGQAQSLLQAANAYKQQVVLKAQADVAEFLALLPEYKKAPEVTKQRLYISILGGVFKDTRKVFVDTNGTNNMIYLPLDKLMNQPAATQPAVPSVNSTTTPTTTPSQPKATSQGQAAGITTTPTSEKTLNNLARPMRNNPYKGYGPGGNNQ